MELRKTADGVLIKVRVSAGASREEITGIHGGALKITVRQAPERGKANKAVQKLLAATLALRPADVEVFRGHTTRDKWVLVRGVDEPKLRANLVRFGPQ